MEERRANKHRIISDRCVLNSRGLMGYYVGVVHGSTTDIQEQPKQHNRDLQEDNIKADFKNNMDDRGLNSSGSREGQVVGCSQHLRVP